TTFEKSADFHQAIFATYVNFAGEKDRTCFGDRSYLNLQHSRIEKPERASFHTLKLRPHWFINVDARKFEFVNVKWPDPPSLSQEVKSLLALGKSSPHRLLSIAYRQLAVNAEENHRYNEASDFRFGSMEASRLEKQKESIKKTWENSTYLILLWLYRVASGSGERVGQAI